MATHRRILLALAILLVGGSMGWTSIYGLRLRSEAYRREVVEDLTKFFELPCDVGRIRGRTFSSRAFENVDIWLPDRRGRVFHCKRAIWQERDGDGRKANELELADGVLMLGTDRWVRADYRQVLQSALSHDFERLNLSRIGMERFEISFDRGGLAIHFRETTGIVDLSKPGDGVASLTAYELNGHRISQGVRIHARFLPGNAIAVTEMNLTLPEIPLAVLSTGSAAFGSIRSGRFAGNVQYNTRESDPELWISGDLDDADLGEATQSLPIGPLRGRFSVKVYGARIHEGIVTHLRGHGQLSGLTLAPLASLLRLKSLSGAATLRLDAIDLAEGRINHLAVSGEVSDLALEEWLEPLGSGSATGRLSIRINNLDLQDDRIKAADIELTLKPQEGHAGTVDRALLLNAAQRLLRFTWPAGIPESVLPEKVAYLECGVRLLVADNRLRILGTHGRNSDTVLTVSILGQPLGIVKEQPGMIDLGPWLEKIKERLQAYPPDRLREWLKSGALGP